MKAPDELTERQASLVGQVQAGEITEQQPDTEEQLLGLARLGHLEASHDADGWHFTVAAGEQPPTEGEPTPTEGEPTPTEGEPTPTPTDGEQGGELQRLLADLERFGEIVHTDDGRRLLFTPHDAPADGAPPDGEPRES